MFYTLLGIFLIIASINWMRSFKITDVPVTVEMHWTHWLVFFLEWFVPAGIFTVGYYFLTLG